MFLRDGIVVTSASDLTAASTCEFAFMRTLDAKLGRIEPIEFVADDMLQRTSALGDIHEHRVLDEYRKQYGRGVIEIARPDIRGDGELEAAVAATNAAFAHGADVVFQATFFDGGFLGFADFIVRTENGAYQVQDSKLARSAKITALLQLAAYSDQLQRLGIPTDEKVVLILGDNRRSEHLLRDILPVYRKRKDRLAKLVASRLSDPLPTEWGDSRYSADGRCAVCEEQVQLHRDVLLVAGLSVSQRAKLRAARINTIDELAVACGPVADLADASFNSLRQQAQLQISPTDAEHPLVWAIANRNPLAAIPLPDEGDIFFDFEGDPLHQEGNIWGLDYLFGLVEPDETFRAFWAHDLAEERQALVDFLSYVKRRREQHPGMHVYHYASYERTHLLMLAARHGVGEEDVDDLLRNNVLVDLYPIVRRGLRIGTRSYSLKKLEPLYMGEQEREGVANAGDSITEYVRSRELHDGGDIAAADAVLDDIARYNTYDCVSTLRLRDWLRVRAAEAGVDVPTSAELRLPVPLQDPDPVFVELAAKIEHTPPAQRNPDETALALASAAIDYHRREAKSFWWDHFSRLVEPLEDWADTRNVFVVESATVERDWSVEGQARTKSRVLRLEGAAAPGSSFGTSAEPYVIYDQPYPPIEASQEPGARYAHSRTRFELGDDDVYRLTERLKMGAPEYDNIPVAIAPAKPPNAGTQITAISEWGRSVLDSLPVMLPNPALDILRRVAPRAQRIVPAIGDPREAIRDTLLTLDQSYLAVQGPPGSGKTYVGSHVIAELVRDHGWKVGVVAQSHATIENMLAAVVEAGLDPALVAKKPKKGDEAQPTTWTTLTDSTAPAFPGRSGGFVLGGTAWTFSNAAHVPRGALDLLVIDEAGQYSLASTIAASVCAQRLLLLGDPQQLPQVSQGTHPEPVDVSALGWLSQDHDVLPPEFGYFLSTSWRMHPELCKSVSALSYEGKLQSHQSDRHLDGIAPGLHPYPIAHEPTSTSSDTEAEVVVELVRNALGRPWSVGGVTAPLSQQNIIVVAPYNAQVELIREHLDAARFTDVPVGTVDKFQGQEAAISIVSLAASSAAEAPRGLDFLLLPNRLNVAISRAQWASYLVFSPELSESLPKSVAGMTQLSAFIALTEETP
jgi:predicted RecB family nuclease